MRDEEVEAHLRRYRPIGPPPDLRGRVVGARLGDGRPGALGWLSLAATVTLIVVFHTLAARESNDIDRMLAAQDRGREAAIREIEEVLGGDEVARENARVAVAMSDWDLNR